MARVSINVTYCKGRKYFRYYIKKFKYLRRNRTPLTSYTYKNKDDTISQQCHPLYNQNSSTNCGSCASLPVTTSRKRMPGAALSRLLCLHRLGSLTIKAIVFL